MLDSFFSLSQEYLKNKNEDFKRYFYFENNLDNRFSIITGGRGVGKTVFIIQYIMKKFNDIFTDKAIYIPVDHIFVENKSLYSIAEEFYKYGGKLICLDEIHKYSNWSKEMKSIYDTFPELQIIASGSSALEISKGSNDLSRRAILYSMNGLSFREFLALYHSIDIKSYFFEDLIKGHQEISNTIYETINKADKKILKLFSEYLEYGYYPYFKEFNDKKYYYVTLEQNVKTTLESDLLSIHPNITGVSLKKIKKLLAIISKSVPFTPDLKNLKNLVEVADERTLKTYLKYLEDAGIIICLSKRGRGLGELEKPEKIYLNNTNLIYALSENKNFEKGNIRETFFVNNLSFREKIATSKQGDFIVSDKYIVEVGGRNKDFNQIKDIENSFLVLDEIETGFKNKIPLWLFGFLY
ncbi:MAG: AAA family ATPase [Spirochaetes bacterium]|nr:AAA family ATPase [Spirochaetota bacterium]